MILRSYNELAFPQRGTISDIHGHTVILYQPVNILQFSIHYTLTMRKGEHIQRFITGLIYN